MTNHPNRSQKTHFVVRYGNDKRARFSDYFDAMWFAEQVSMKAGWAEVGHKTGLVGQYNNGVTTPEFAAHHATRTAGV